MKLKKEARQVNQKFCDFYKGEYRDGHMHKKQRRQDRDGLVMMTR